MVHIIRTNLDCITQNVLVVTNVTLQVEIICGIYYIALFFKKLFIIINECEKGECFNSESVRNYPDANMGTVPRALNAGNCLDLDFWIL